VSDAAILEFLSQQRADGRGVLMLGLRLFFFFFFLFFF